MKVDASIGGGLGDVRERAMHLEALGYDGLKVAELNHDPFLPLTIAAEHTRRIELITSVAVAFARNPMSMAQLAHDLNAFSGGRLILGLGSQVKPHIERRFAMPWGKPAARMRDFILAMRAIFDCWYDGVRLDYQGEYYRHDLMPATFTPKDVELPRPRIVLSATGPLMTQVAAEVADGMMMHPFSTERYMREVTLPAIEKGLADRDRIQGALSRGMQGARPLQENSFALDYAPMIATAKDDEGIERAVAAVRGRIAFYACTVAYRPVLDLHGWGALQDELIPLNRAHRTADMARLIDDDVLDAIAIVGKPMEVAQKMKQRFRGLVTRTAFEAPALPTDELMAAIAELQN